MFPSRFVHLEAARARFGDRVDRLGPHLMRADPLADAVAEAIADMPRGAGSALFDRLARGASDPAPEAMRAFFAEVEHVPAWVDWDRVDRGGRVLLRAGPAGGLVLGLKSLVLAYTSPAGNKPLVFSGRLTDNAPRRLDETARFVRETITPGGLRPRAGGWRVTLKVRLIHAQIRRMILKSGRWDSSAWGVPINQHDEVGTLLLFSAAVLEGLRTLGVRVTAGDAEATMHLWRWSAHLLGVDPDLVPVTESEALRLAELMRATQGPPDADSRALTRALLESPKRRARAVAFASAMSRLLVGDAIADQLGIERSPWSYAVAQLPRVAAAADRLRRLAGPSDARALERGTAYWDRVAADGLADATAAFVVPERLAFGPSSTRPSAL